MRWLVWGVLAYLGLLFFLFVWAGVQRRRSARARTGLRSHAELQLLEQLTEAHRVAVRANSGSPAEQFAVGGESFAGPGGESADSVALELAKLAVADEEA